MKSIVPITMLALCSLLPAQNPPGQPPPGQQQAPRGTQQNAPVPQPGDRPVPNPQLPEAAGQSFVPQTTGMVTAAPIQGMSLSQAMERARQYNQQFLTAATTAQSAHEDTGQATAALLPTATFCNQFIYSQPNGTPSGVFVANDGPHIYNQQLIVHGDIWAPGKIADYRRATAAEAVARARADIAARGLITVVVQGYYGMLSAQRKLANAQQSLQEASDFLDITRKLEQGGEAAHADVVKAQIQYEQRRLDVQNAQLDYDKARISFGVVLFPNYGQQFSLANDMETVTTLPPFPELQAMADRNNPDIRAAQATVTQQTYELTSNRAGLYPSLSFDYFYGINANQYATHNREGLNVLGSAAQAQLSIPVWNWGATRSKIRQSQFRLQQARTDLSLTQRQLVANLNSFYAEAGLSAAQLDTLRRMVALGEESLRLTRLRYQAGEATAQEVVDAQTTLATARNALSDGLVRYRVALANLQTVTGAF
jgi:outer membrane protein TolC